MITKREQIAKMIYLSKGMYSKNYKNLAGGKKWSDDILSQMLPAVDSGLL